MGIAMECGQYSGDGDKASRELGETTVVFRQ